MTPRLPQEDPDSRARADQLEKTRAKYRFEPFMGYALVGEVPRGDRFDAGYIANAAEHAIRVASNQALSRATEWGDTAIEAIHDRLRDIFSSENDAMELLRASAAELREGFEATHPLTIERYEDMFPLLPTPASAGMWRDDSYFAWQRIAGCNPILLAGVERLPPHFPVSDAHLARTLPDDSLAAAGAEGRLFLLDYPMMATVPFGETEGRPKFLDAPMAAFVRSKAGPLVAVAIQCGQAPGPKTPIYTPGDGFAWQMAKTSVQVADANFQGAITHLGYCHLVMESVIVSAHRQLAESHPLHVLLEPHFEFTLSANAYAKETLFCPGGNTDRLQSGTIEGTTALVQGALAAYAFCRTDAPTAFADRRVDDLEGLPDYPFRDDALASYGPIERFARAYVRLYYQSADDVAGDEELHAWVREMGASDGGKLHRVIDGERLETVEDVVMLVTRILYTCTTYHAAINYSSWDFLAYPPNAPAAAWAPGPAPGTVANEPAHLAMMPPLDISFATIELMYSISMTRNRVGKYPPLHFRDPRVLPLLRTLRRELAEAESLIEQRNGKRPFPYPYLLPSRISRSIHV